MPATGQPIDAGSVVEMASKFNDSLGAKVETLTVNGVTYTANSKAINLGPVVTAAKTTDGAPVPVVNGVLTLPAPAAAAPSGTTTPIATTPLASIITN